MQPLRIDLARAALDQNYILLLTTNSTERLAVNAALEKPLRAQAPFEHEGCALGELGGRFVLHVTGTSGAQKVTSVDRIVKRLLAADRMPRPYLVVLAGIAWGAPGKVEKGDVVLCGEIVSASETRKEAGATRYRDLAHASRLLSLVEPLSSALRKVPDGFQVHSGRLASAPTHFSDDGARDELLEQIPSVLGGEMEAFALMPDLDTPWLVLRGVSDFGEDDLSRAFQHQAADHLAGLLVPLVQALEQTATLEPRRDDEFTLGLSATLAGRSLEIARPDDTVDLKDHLNMKIGPTLEYRLRQYVFQTEDDDPLAGALTNLLLEKAHNAFRHGHAQQVRISFNDYSVDYADNGGAYDLLALQRGRGGAAALKVFQDDFVPDLVNIIPRKPPKAFLNAYRFEFTSISRAFSIARSTCELTINEWAVRKNAPFEHQVSFPTGCEALFYDLTNVMMASIHIDKAQVFRTLLAEGKSLFLLVRNRHDKRLYETELSDYSGNQLTVFIAR